MVRICVRAIIATSARDDSSARSPECDRDNRVCYRVKTFVKAVNKHLPQSIRINGVRRVADGFSSRRNCIRRTYKYFFPLGNMDLGLMHEASQYFVGNHNFQQFCKMDNRNPRNPNTTIYSFAVERYNDLLCVATVSGRAFLWHQVRCMVGVLFLVGEGAISGIKIKELLEHPEGTKFNYKMAGPHGLILLDCGFDIPTEPRPAINCAVYQEMLTDTLQTLGPLSLLAKGD
ncbi:tRNA pseudouridine synthase A family protein [Babesia caballi]|uniref:tRNA pseudouridine synthase n=1 Tax=Babesia caballi TaxID=5871 RepID=A0AAV4LLR3_BABCB|nr:tRNA pseudouridine synthase A family protein [Babesia caballi]